MSDNRGPPHTDVHQSAPGQTPHSDDIVSPPVQPPASAPPTPPAALYNDPQLSAASMDAIMIDTSLLLDGEEGFDPDTLAHLAALSRFPVDDEEGVPIEQDEPEPEEEPLETGSPREPLTSEQVQEWMNQLAKDKEKEQDVDKEKESDRRQTPEEDDERDERGSSPEDEDEHDYGNGTDGGSDNQKGKRGRKRNRVVLSCTECHRRASEHCDRKIPCSRCLKRGVPGMCRMEAPAVPPRKRRKREGDEDLNHELGLRVQSLEALLRSSGSLVNPDHARAAAHDTVRDAHKAAKAGSTDATNALAQLSQGVEGLSRGAQSSLLMDVLQQLTQASMGRPLTSSGQSGARTEKKGLEVWSSLPMAAQETTVAVASAFEADETTTKMIISDPGFRDDAGKYFIPPTVKYIENKVRAESMFNMEALPIEGFAPFLDAGIKFGYGADSHPYRQKRISALQGVSLTGGLRLAATFLSRFPPTPTAKTVYIPSPTADEDVSALQDAGLEIRTFRFLDQETGGVDWESLKEDLSEAPLKSLVLLHVGGSAPSGAELTTNQWRSLATLLQEREMIPLVIMAYQGLSTGDTARDAQALRFMVHEGIPVVCVQSFETLMGLYADSPSIVSVVTRNNEDKDRVDSQLRAVARAMWVHPSPYGARIAHMMLTDERVYPSWLKEIKLLSDRLRSARMKLYTLLTERLRTPGNWVHIKKTAGMYCTALLPSDQAEALTNKHHIHLLPESCFNLGSLSATKIEILSRAIDSVVREGIRQAEEANAQRIAMELALAAAREQQMREEAAREEERQAEMMQAARDEDTLLMERSIANAIERQQREEEEERTREEQRERDDEMAKKQREREEIARQAEAILATI